MCRDCVNMVGPSTILWDPLWVLFSPADPHKANCAMMSRPSAALSMLSRHDMVTAPFHVSTHVLVIKSFSNMPAVPSSK